MIRTCNTALDRRRSAALLAVLALVFMIGGCGEEEPVREEPAGLPDWVEMVHPDPGAQVSPTPQVQVTHGVVGVREGVRLEVNGTDVTQYTTETKPGVLAYDPNHSRAPVELKPGTHQAAVHRVRLEEFGEQHEVLDTFEWEFRIQ